MMGLALHDLDRFTNFNAPRDQREALEQYRRGLRRIRLELAELKRIGSQAGIADLNSDALIFSMRLRRLETSWSLE